jgi:hypothetical protein
LDESDIKVLSSVPPNPCSYPNETKDDYDNDDAQEV